MSLERPGYWLVYVPESTETGPPEVAAVAPEMLRPERFSTDTQGLLVAADSFHAHHLDQRVVFAGALTRWVHAEGLAWHDLDVDFFEALSDLEEHAPALLIEATQVTMGVVADAAKECTIWYADGGSEPLDRHVEPVRTALLQALVRDWPPYVRCIAVTVATRSARSPEASPRWLPKMSAG
jgi:hypothetical protein